VAFPVFPGRRKVVAVAVLSVSAAKGGPRSSPTARLRSVRWRTDAFASRRRQVVSPAWTGGRPRKPGPVSQPGVFSALV
jgi:hypothetical protein